MMAKLSRIAAMTRTNTIRAFRSPTHVAWSVLVPVIFSFIVSSLFGGSGPIQPEVVVVNEGDSAEAEAFIAGLTATPFAVQQVEREVAMARLAAGATRVAIVIPPGFGAAVKSGEPVLELLHGPGYVPGSEEARARVVADALAEGRAIPGTQVSAQTPRGHAADDSFERVRAVFGVYLMFAFAALFVRGAALHKERQEGTLQRIVAAGVPYGEVVAAHVATIFLVGLLQAAIIVPVTAALGTQWLLAGWFPLLIALLGALFVASGIAVGLTGIARSATLLQGLAGGLAPLLAMLGGAFFPLDVAPAGMQQLARMNPVHWAMELLATGLVFEGGPAQIAPLAVLVLIGTLGIVVGVQGLRRVEL